MPNTTPSIYKLVSCGNGFKSGLWIESNKDRAIEAFCRFHNLYPAQVAVLYSYPLDALI